MRPPFPALVRAVIERTVMEGTPAIIEPAPGIIPGLYDVTILPTMEHYKDLTTGQVSQLVAERKLVKAEPDPRSTDRKHVEFGSAGYDQRLEKRVTTIGWEPTCECDADTAPAVVLDPFAGAGTTLLVAEQLGRDSIGIELNPEYAAISTARIQRWEADPAGRLKSFKKERSRLEEMGQMGMFADLERVPE